MSRKKPNRIKKHTKGVFGFSLVCMGAVHTVGPNKALVISGGCLGGRRVRTVIGGWGWVWCCLNQVQILSLEVMTLNPTCRRVQTTEGVPLTVTGVAQVKVLAEKELLTSACEQFLELDTQRIENTILQTLEGHLRAILGTLTVEAICKDRDQFAALVREVAAPDVGRMGIEILSFTIKDIFDEIDYLNSLGRPRIADVKRDANIGVAEAERDAGIREIECERERIDVRCVADAAIADNKCKFAAQKAEFCREINVARAEADLANKLQSAIERQQICDEEIRVEVVQQTKQIEVEEDQVKLKARQLESKVLEPVLAEAYRIQKIAEGKKQRKILLAQGHSDSIRMIGFARARVIDALGDSEAESLIEKAAAFAEFTEAAKLSLVLDRLPSLAAEICAPLAKTGEIVVMCGDPASKQETVGPGPATVGSLCRGFVHLSPAVHARAGVDFSKCVGQVPGAKLIG